MFNLQEFLSELAVPENDIELKQALEIIELTEIICDDAWLARQDHFGSAGAMERQLEYIGSTLLPNVETQISRMSSDGVRGESYVQDSWFGATNTENPHISDEVDKDERIDNRIEFANQLRTRMRTAAIIFVTRVRAHDALSSTLEQLSYQGIKAKAASNRRANENRAVSKVATG